MTKIHDISLTISAELPIWIDDPSIEIERILKLENGDIANVTRLSMSAHTGTHVDAPCHFIEGGSSIDQLPLEVLVGKAIVIEIPSVDIISEHELRNADIPAGCQRLLIKTKNSKEWQEGIRAFHTDYVAIDENGAKFIVDKGIKLVGIDYLSIAPYHEITETHKILLQANVIPLEALDLSKIKPGEYVLYCLPLKIANADGAPVRAILIEA